MMFIDSTQEQLNEVGREWSLPPLEANEIYLPEGVAASLGATVDSVVLIQFNLAETIATMHNQYLNATNGDTS